MRDPPFEPGLPAAEFMRTAEALIGNDNAEDNLEMILPL
jgi:hypothetical protein